MRVRRTPAILSIAVMAAVLGVSVSITPGVGLSPSACRVKNVTTGVTKTTIQSAVKAAKSGHKLTLRGTCHGTTTIGKKLTITGIRPSGAGKPTLDGDQKGAVVTINAGVRVTLKSLTVTDGSGTPGLSGAIGGGIDNHGTLTLTGVHVDDNTVNGYGGGIHNTGTLTIGGSSTVSRNTAAAVPSQAGLGGGIWNSGTLTLAGSATVSANDAQDGGGIWNAGTGSVTLGGTSSVADNDVSRDAGGVWNESGGTVTLNTASSISGNDASTDNAGGVYNFGTMTLNGTSRITGNHALSAGGGVSNSGTLTLNGSSSIDTNTTDPDGSGGGLMNNGTASLHDTSSIADNSSSTGGGVRNDGGSFSLADPGTSIHGNSAAYGGAVALTGGTLDFDCATDSRVHDNGGSPCYP